MPTPTVTATPPINYGGVNITPPAPIKSPIYNPGSSISNYISQLSTAQNAANQANNQRYGQGLGVLSQGYGQGAQYLQNAADNTANIGKTEQQQIDIAKQQGLGGVVQNTVSRGLNNTTIQDALKSGVNRTADLATTANNESIARQQNAVMEQQAAQANQGAQGIAGYIAQRSDKAPDQSAMAALVQGAASNASGARRTAQIGGNMPPAQGWIGSSSTPPVSSGGAGGGGALGSGQYFNMATGGGSTGGGGAGSYSGGGSIANAISGTGTQAPTTSADDQYSQAMANAGYGKGAISITPNSTNNNLAVGQSSLNNAGNTVVTRLPDATDNAQPKRVFSPEDAAYYSQVYGAGWMNNFGGPDNVVVKG